MNLRPNLVDHGLSVSVNCGKSPHGVLGLLFILVMRLLPAAHIRSTGNSPNQMLMTPNFGVLDWRYSSCKGRLPACETKDPLSPTFEPRALICASRYTALPFETWPLHWLGRGEVEALDALYFELGISLSSLERYQEAIAAYRQSCKLWQGESATETWQDFRVRVTQCRRRL